MLGSEPLAPCYINVISPTKPEMHNVSQRCQRTEPWPQVTCTKIWWRSAVWFSSYASGQTDRQTLITILWSCKHTMWLSHLLTIGYIVCSSWNIYPWQFFCNHFDCSADFSDLHFHPRRLSRAYPAVAFFASYILLRHFPFPHFQRRHLPYLSGLIFMQSFEIYVLSKGKMLCCALSSARAPVLTLSETSFRRYLFWNGCPMPIGLETTDWQWAVCNDLIESWNRTFVGDL